MKMFEYVRMFLLARKMVIRFTVLLLTALPKDRWASVPILCFLRTSQLAPQGLNHSRGDFAFGTSSPVLSSSQELDGVAGIVTSMVTR